MGLTWGEWHLYMYGESERKYNYEKLSLCCEQLSLLETGIKMLIALLLPHLSKQWLVINERSMSFECRMQPNTTWEKGKENKEEFTEGCADLEEERGGLSTTTAPILITHCVEV